MTATSDSICFLPATQLAARVRRRELSPVEVVAAFLARIEERNPVVNAYVTVLAEQATAAAARAEEAVMTGRPLAPLHGVPVAIKDLEPMAGVVNTYGSRPFANYVPETSAIHVERLQAAGAIVIGKTNVPEFGHKGTTDNLLFGPTHTPFALGMNAGGSSGGSAAAVADGMAALAQGGDGGGSVRIPAALSGVCGLIATFGRVPYSPRPDGFHSRAHFLNLGPLARSVDDAALMLSVMAGPHRRDMLSLPKLQAPPEPGAGDDPVAALRGLRVAYTRDFGGFPIAPDVRELVDRAVTDLEAAGAVVDEIDPVLPASHDELSAAWRRGASALYAAMAADYRRHGIDLDGELRSQLTSYFAEYLDTGAAMTAVEYKLDDILRTGTFDALEDLFDSHDLIVGPTVAVSGIPNQAPDTVGPSEINGVAVDPLIGWCPTLLVNFTGHPAISIPAGFTDEGLPVGLQMIARRFHDDALIAASRGAEHVRPWHSAYGRLS